MQHREQVPALGSIEKKETRLSFHFRPICTTWYVIRVQGEVVEAASIFSVAIPILGPVDPVDPMDAKQEKL